MFTIMFSMGVSAYANTYKANEELNSKEIEIYVYEWITKNYSEHYILSDFNITMIDFKNKNKNFEATLMVELKTLLKYDDVEKLPYFIGLKNELGINKLDFLESNKQFELEKYNNIKKNNFSDTQIKMVKENLKNKYSDAKECINEPTLLTLDIVVKGSKGDNKDWDVYVDEMGKLYPAKKYTPATTKELENLGKQDLIAVVDTVKSLDSEMAMRGYSSYDRIDARDYALNYSSNGKNYCKCYTLYGVDYSKWNNFEYPYFSNACHNDCADFVSQAMHEGGIPIDPGNWERLKDGNSSYGGEVGWAWTYVPSLKDYMTSKGYWNVSNFSDCCAGNILLTSSEHIGMITLNDTVTHRYTAHTRDRKNYQFYNNSNYEYYMIKGN